MQEKKTQEKTQEEKLENGTRKKMRLTRYAENILQKLLCRIPDVKVRSSNFSYV